MGLWNIFLVAALEKLGVTIADNVLTIHKKKWHYGEQLAAHESPRYRLQLEEIGIISPNDHQQSLVLASMPPSFIFSFRTWLM